MTFQLFPQVTPSTSRAVALTTEESQPPSRFSQPPLCPILADHRLSFEQLPAFSRVTDQFLDVAILFERAVALTPSNPSFAGQSASKVLIPAAGPPQLKIKLLKPMTSMTLTVQGYGVVTLTFLDHQAEIIEPLSVQRFRYTAATAEAPIETVALADGRLRQVILESSQVFALTALTWQ